MEMTKAPLRQPGITHLPNVHSRVNAESCIHEDIVLRICVGGRYIIKNIYSKQFFSAVLYLSLVLPLA